MDHQSKRSGRYGTVGRRGFFRSLAGETIAFFEELRGKPQFRLDDLGQFPDEELAQIMPKMRPDVEIIVAEGHISARLPKKGEVIFLFDREPANTFVFNRFNGRTTMRQIGTELAAALSWEEERSFAHVRSFFLRLVHLRVCVPGNPMES